MQFKTISPEDVQLLGLGKPVRSPITAKIHDYFSSLPTGVWCQIRLEISDLAMPQHILLNKMRNTARSLGKNITISSRKDGLIYFCLVDGDTPLYHTKKARRLAKKAQSANPETNEQP